MKSTAINSYISNEGYSPRNKGITYSDDPNHPLWKIIVHFPRTPPMKELIKAPTQRAAMAYAKRKYPEAVKVEYLGKAVPTRGRNGEVF